MDLLSQRVDSQLQSSFLCRRSSNDTVACVDVNTGVSISTFFKVLSKASSDVTTSINDLAEVSCRSKRHHLDLIKAEGVTCFFEDIISHRVDSFVKVLLDVLVTTSDSLQCRLSKQRDVRLSLSITQLHVLHQVINVSSKATRLNNCLIYIIVKLGLNIRSGSFSIFDSSFSALISSFVLISLTFFYSFFIFCVAFSVCLFWSLAFLKSLLVFEPASDKSSQCPANVSKSHTLSGSLDTSYPRVIFFINSQGIAKRVSQPRHILNQVRKVLFFRAARNKISSSTFRSYLSRLTYKLQQTVTRTVLLPSVGSFRSNTYATG